MFNKNFRNSQKVYLKNSKKNVMKSFTTFIGTYIRLGEAQIHCSLYLTLNVINFTHKMYKNL